MINIAFLVSANKTIVFHNIASRLKNNHYESFWISPSQNWTNWLLKNGVFKKNILNIPEKISNIDSEELTQDQKNKISVIEKEGNISIRDIYLMDRVLRDKNANYALKYMLCCYEEILCFLVDNKVTSVFSEQTWNFEIITTLVCNTLDIDSLYVDSVRVPDGEKFGRFAFFQGFLMDTLSFEKNIDKENILFAEEFLYKFRNEKKGTSYLNNYFVKPSLSFKLLKKLFKHVKFYYTDKYDNTRQSIYFLVIYRVRQLLNLVQIRFLMQYYPIDSIRKKYIFIALHKEPDSALDVQSSNFINQFEAIKAFIRKVPTEYEVIVKDHSHALGLNSLRRYKKLSRLPFVRIVNPMSDTFSLISGASMVFSIGGTVSLEAALMGKRSVTVSKKYFSEVLIRESFDPYSCSTYEVQKMLKEMPPSDEKLINYIAKIHANSFKGLLFDPTAHEIYRSSDNFNNLYLGFKEFLEKN
jgi:hypothetical protein